MMRGDGLEVLVFPRHVAEGLEPEDRIAGQGDSIAVWFRREHGLRDADGAAAAFDVLRHEADAHAIFHVRLQASDQHVRAAARRIGNDEGDRFFRISGGRNGESRAGNGKSGHSAQQPFHRVSSLSGLSVRLP